MSDEQRQAMIQGMVASLAAKQAADPANLDGWLRLGRAYTVLHEPDKAADAFDKAAGLKPDDVSIPLQEVRALLSDHAPTDKLPPRVIGLLKHVEATDPDQPLMLWYLGMASAQDAHPDEARRYWAKLLAKVPAGSEDARMIQAALDTLSRQKAGSGG
jgi:cytochrome c-type biogenesis protein CcmH